MNSLNTSSVQNENNRGGFGSVLFLIAVIYILYRVFFSESWDLIVCSKLMKDGAQCYENLYVEKGFKSQEACMTAGNIAKRAGVVGFECGKNCKDDRGFSVCDTICNKAGCSD